MIDETAGNDSTNAAPIGFCQDCGRPLTPETIRTVGSARFCEPCLETRLGAGTVAGATGAVPPPYGGTPYGAPPPPPPPYGGATPPPNAGGPVYSEPFPPVGGSSPSPVLAGFLGLIPGVGAMYNGQFAKGIAHIVIYAVLQSLANQNGVFGILVAGWVFYQVFDAYHTAKARRDGMPLPDPFNLNDIGKHVGVHFRGGTPGAPPNPIHSAGYAPYSGTVPPQAVVTPPPDTVVPPPAQAWGNVPVPPAYTQAAQAWEAPAWTPQGAVPVAGQEWVAPGYDPVVVAPVAVLIPSRFPGAAIWLIGFGVLFLILNLIPDLRFRIHEVFPFLLMALAVGLFVRRMSATGGIGPYAAESEAAYASRSILSLRAPVVLFTIGVLMSLQSFDVVRFGRTWPVLVIVIGVQMLLERSLGSRVVAMPVAGTAPSVDANAVNGDGKGV